MARPTFTLTHLLRRSGEVLEAVEGEDVVLRRRDADDALLTTVPRDRAVREALGLLAEAVAGLSAEVASAVARGLGERLPWTAVLSDDERMRFLEELGRAAAVAAELETAEPLQGTLDRWRRAARVRASTRPRSAHETRPVFIPDDVDDPGVEKATGVVELPLHVRWHPRRTYDLRDRRKMLRVYEQVLREGTDEDVRKYIDVDTLIREWDRLVLPPRVRRAWSDWLRERRGIELAC